MKRRTPTTAQIIFYGVVFMFILWWSAVTLREVWGWYAG